MEILETWSSKFSLGLSTNSTCQRDITNGAIPHRLACFSAIGVSIWGFNGRLAPLRCQYQIFAQQARPRISCIYSFFSGTAKLIIPLIAGGAGCRRVVDLINERITCVVVMGYGHENGLPLSLPGDGGNTPT